MIILIIKMTLCVVIPGSLECALHIHECCDARMCKEPADLGGRGSEWVYTLRPCILLNKPHPF